MVSTSLSPRPDSVTTIDWVFFIFEANFIAYATACEDSSAGKMPSSLLRVRNASTASLSVAEVYCARLRVFSKLCSGPTPG